MKYIIAHDLGTSGDKASLYTVEGEFIASAVCEYKTEYSHGCWAEQDPGKWWSAICSATQEIMQGQNKKDVACIALSGQMMGCLCIDQNGTPLTNSIIWQDSRAKEEAKLLTERVGGVSEGCRMAGQQISANYTLSKLMWIKKHMPDVYSRTRTVFTAKDYITFRMTGSRVTDPSDASLMQAYDMEKGEWSEKLIGCAEVDGELFPEIRLATDIIGTVTKKAAEELELQEGTPVITGAGDGTCATLGAGATVPGEGYASVGTSTWLCFVTDKLTPDPMGKIQIYPFTSKDTYNMAGTMQGGGLTYRWAREQFFPEGTSYDEINKLIETSPPGANGVLFLPYLMGERSPWWNANVRGSFLGLSGATNKADMLRAVLEGVTYNMRLILDDIRKMNRFEGEMNMIGGGAKGDVWAQMFADAFNMTVYKPQTVEEATSFGAVILAAVGIGAIPDFDSAKKLIRIISQNNPNAERTKIYEERARIFKDAYLALEPLAERILMGGNN